MHTASQVELAVNTHSPVSRHAACAAAATLYTQGSALVVPLLRLIEEQCQV